MLSIIAIGMPTLALGVGLPSENPYSGFLDGSLVVTRSVAEGIRDSYFRE